VPRLQRGQGVFLDAFAKVFCEAGFCALVYDNRNLGASDGEPRQEIDPQAQIADYRHAITFARSLDEVDGDRIGIWGSSYSGAHVLVVGAIDRRVKCVVAQVPLISGRERAPADPLGPDRADAGGRRARGRTVRAADAS
jgi:dienelactone hydrolase